MSYQKTFNYHFSSKIDHENFFINHTNQEAYEATILENFDQNIFLFGPEKSGKSYLASLWKDKNDAISFNDNFIYSFCDICIPDIKFIKLESHRLFCATLDI